MKIFSTDVSTTPQQLAVTHRDLVIAFVLMLLLVVVQYFLVLPVTFASPPIGEFLGVALGICAIAFGFNAFLAIYTALTQLGFSKVFAIIIIVFATIFPLTEVVIIIIDIVVTRRLKSKGWKISFWKAVPSHPIQ